MLGFILLKEKFNMSKNDSLHLVLGASAKEDRASNQAVRKLKMYGYKVMAVSNKLDMIGDTPIETDFPAGNVHTLTMYLSAVNQKPYYEKILALHPGRIIFNPGAENDELEKLAYQNGIETEEACTLVLLNTGQY